MARKQTLDLILKTFRDLGGNLNEVMGTRTNINFLGKGKSPELMLDMDINTDALAVLPQSKAVEELTSSVGYAVSNKLNDVQANKLLENMTKMKNFYMPPAAPANITDLATRTRNLDKEGLMSLRQGDPAKFRPNENLPSLAELRKTQGKINLDEIDNIPPLGSRGGPDDIAAPFSGSGLEALKNVKNNDLIMNDVVNKIYLNAGVAENAQPVVRANAREFLNRIKNLSDEVDGTNLSSVMEADDFRFMTEGGGGAMGDPFLLVQKYFGPKVAAAVAKLDTPNDIQLFAERLISVKDARGRGVTDRMFDPDTVDISDFEFADGGRVGLRFGGDTMGGPNDKSESTKGADEGGQSRFDVGSGYYGETTTPTLSGGGDGDKRTTLKLPFNVSVQPDVTDKSAAPRYLDIAAAIRGGLLNLRTDLFDTIKDEELDSELTYTGGLGPFNINARTDFDDINQASFDYNKNNIFASGRTDFDDQNQLNLGYQKGPFQAGVTTDLDGNNQFQAGFNIKYADGGLARLGYRGGKLVGKALGMFKRQQAIKRGTGEGFAAAEAYGITGKDISRLFAELARDPSLVGKEKTEYFKILNQALKNPEDFPDEILQIQKKLGIDIGMKSGGLAKILEV